MRKKYCYCQTLIEIVDHSIVIAFKSYCRVIKINQIEILVLMTRTCLILSLLILKNTFV